MWNPTARTINTIWRPNATPVNAGTANAVKIYNSGKKKQPLNIAYKIDVWSIVNSYLFVFVFVSFHRIDDIYNLQLASDLSISIL